MIRGINDIIIKSRSIIFFSPRRYSGIPSLAHNIRNFIPIVRAQLFSTVDSSRRRRTQKTPCTRVRFADRFASSEHKISITSIYYLPRCYKVLHGLHVPCATNNPFVKSVAVTDSEKWTRPNNPCSNWHENWPHANILLRKFLQKLIPNVIAIKIIEVFQRSKDRFSNIAQESRNRCKKREENSTHEQHIVGRNLTSISRKVDVFASIFDTWFDTQYLTGPDVCLWTRSKDHEQPFSIFPFVIVDRLSYLIILRAAGCARKREGEKGSKSGAGFFFDEIMASELSFSFFHFFHSNPHPFDLHFSRMERNLLQLLPLSRIWNMEYSLNFE